MQPNEDRHARNSQLFEPSRRRLRWAACLAAALTLLTGAIPAAEAATGGASPAESAPPPTATTSDGSELAFTALHLAGASWYGPGLYGRQTACGQTLRPNTIGVAHKRLPCGTVVKFIYRGRALITQVIDRGPYIRGRAWDLTEAASEALGFSETGVGKVRYAIAREYARPQG